MTESEAVLYMVRAACPECRTEVSHAEVREVAVPLDMDVGVRADYFPACGFPLGGTGDEWDVREEAEVERVEPTDPATVPEEEAAELEGVARDAVAVMQGAADDLEANDETPVEIAEYLRRRARELRRRADEA